MILRPGISHAWPRRQDDWQALALAVLALFAGFLLVQASLLRQLFDLVAWLLAAIAAGLLRLVGYDILRGGVELRDAVSGHALAVTSACDGHGLLISAAAVFLWFGARSPAARSLPNVLAAMVAAILLFNLVRILALFFVLAMPDITRMQHLYAAPLLSMLLVAGLGFYARKVGPAAVIRSPALWLLLALALAVAWYAVARAATCAVAVPVANAFLWLLPGRLTQAITCATPDPSIITTAVLQESPLTVLTITFDPTDFTLALPLVAASVVLARRPAITVAAATVSLALFSLAMALGAATMSHDQATAAGARTLAGTAFRQSYTPSGELLLAVLKAAQNTLVHFNLFLLPLVLAHWVGASPSSPAAMPRATSSGRRRRR